MIFKVNLTLNLTVAALKLDTLTKCTHTIITDNSGFDK